MSLDQLWELLNFDSSTGILQIVLTVLMLIFCAMLCYFLVKYMSDNSILKKATQQAYAKMNDAEKKRMDASERIKLKIGENDEGNWLDRMDKLVTYSGIKRKFKFISTDMIVIGYIVITTVCIILSNMIWHNPLFGMVAGLLVVALGQSTLVFLSNRQYKLVQENIIKFLNIIENFAATSNDLVTILERTAVYLENPLQDMIFRCVSEARASGDRRYALVRLQDEIQNSYFKELIRALRIGSNYEANYSEIIADSRDTIQKSLKYEEEKQSLRKNARVDMISLLAVGLMCDMMGASVVDMSLWEMMTTTGIGGYILLVYMVVLIAMVIYTGFLKGLSK